MFKEKVIAIKPSGSCCALILENIKRAWQWGPTSLGARITLRLGMVLGLTSLLLFGLIYRLQVRQMHAQIHTQAHALLTNMLTVREWIASYGGVWTTRPGPVYMEERNGFYRKSPAMVTKELSELAADKGLYYFHITSLRLRNPNNAPDPFEARVLREFERNPHPVEHIEYINGKRMYRLMIPLRTTSYCLQCHADQGYHVGDIRGGLSVMVPMDEADRALAQNRLVLLLSAITIMVLVLGAMYIQIRRTIISPIERLTSVAEAISQGDYHVRCQVNTGDELETLANAFNNMIASVAQYQGALHAQVQRRTRELEAIANIALTASEAQPLDVLLNEVLRQVKEVVGAHGGTICLYSGTSMDFVAMLDVPPAVRRCLQDRSQQASIAEFVRTGAEPLTFSDLRDISTTATDSSLVKCLIEEGGYRSAVTVPLRSRQRTLGFILLFHPRPHHFTSETVQFLASVGNQLGVAIQNAQYHEQVARLAVLEERQRISRELHDSIAQTLGWLSLKLEMLSDDLGENAPPRVRKDVDLMQQVVREAVYDVRESILALRQDPGQRLVSAVGSWIMEFRRRTGLDVEYKVTDKDVPIPPTVEVELFRIVQEALTNVRKHAQARHVRVELHVQPEGIELIVEDDGRGFSPQHTSGEDHFGLRIMRERAESLNGTFHMTSSPGKGTRIHVHLPLKGTSHLFEEVTRYAKSTYSRHSSG